MIRFIASIFLGAFVAFSLFVLMAKLIQNDGIANKPIDAPPVIDIIMADPDENTNTRVRRPPPPPPPPQEPPKVEMIVPDEAETDSTGFSLNIPGIDTGSVGVNIGGIGAMMRDGDATPIVRIDPKYPPEAARDGREGWVELSFTINEVGGVEDVDVLEADPKRIFDREAKRALRKWKYRPKVVDGIAQKQTGLKVRLDFTLGGDG